MRIICWISILFLSHHCLAQQTGQLPVASGYAIDQFSSWKLSDLSTKPFKPFNQYGKVNIGYNRNAAVWCKFKLVNRQKKDVKEWLCFNNNHIDSLTLYDGEDVKLLGDRTTSRSPFIEMQAFEVNLKPEETKVLYVRVKKETSYLEFSYSFEPQDRLEMKSSQKIALTSFFIGMVVLLLMINSILYLMTKNRLYILYIIYSILTAAYASITTNFAKHVLFPEFILFSEFRVYTGALWYIALSYFLSHFLNLRQHQPIKYKFINVLNGINFLLVLFTIVLLVFYPEVDFRVFFIVGYVIFLVVIVTIFLAAIIHLRTDRKQAIYALLAFLPQLVWGACLILKTFEIIPNSLGDNWMVFISLYEVFLFGYVLSRNYIDIFVKNNELMEEVIVEKETSLRTISEVQLRERRNIANIIHDSVGSKLAHIIHLFDMKDAMTAKQTITELAEDIRDLSHKILPKALDDGALTASLAAQIAKLNAGTAHLLIELFSYDFPEKVGEKWIYDLYLISLEIISNSIKHGKSSLITVELYRYPESYHFQFTDDGIGFDLNHTKWGFGLDNIEKRIHYYGGSFEINSIKHEGTVIQITIPTF